MADKYLKNTGLSYFYNRLKTIFALKTEIPTKTSDLTNDGDGTSNFATEEYVEDNGGKIDSISMNGTPQTITNKSVNLIVTDLTVDTTGHGSATISKGTNEVVIQHTATGGARIETSEGHASLLASVGDLPTKTSDLTNDSDFQTEAEVQALIDAELEGITGIEFEVVDTLPAQGVKGTIYLLHNQGQAQDIYDEYIWVSPTGQTAQWEKIGTTDVDLSGYWSKTELVAITTAEIDTIIGA